MFKESNYLKGTKAPINHTNKEREMKRVKRNKVDLRLMVYLLMVVSLSLLVTACSKHVSKK